MFLKCISTLFRRNLKLSRFPISVLSGREYNSTSSIGQTIIFKRTFSWKHRRPFIIEQYNNQEIKIRKYLFSKSCAFNGKSSNNENQTFKLEGKLYFEYTCNICENRSNKMISKQAYNEGVVLVRCEGCENLHLIADNLGWFRDEKVNIEDLMKERGETVTKIGENDLQFIPKQ